MMFALLTKPSDVNRASYAVGRRRALAGALLIVSFAWATGAHATTVAIGAMKDNSIFASSSASSAGGAPGIFAGANGQGSARRGLVAFDIAKNVPGGAFITGVYLTMYLGNAPNSDPQSVELHKLTRDWGEGTAGGSTSTISGSGNGFPADFGDATWSDAKYTSDAWSNPGAVGDFAAAVSASTIVSGPLDSSFTWNSTPTLVSDVQGWLVSPATNFGWALINNNESTTRSIKVFYSREATQNTSNLPNSLDPTWRPTLIVWFTPRTQTTGDYNGNGQVDAADYIVWRNMLGQTVAPAGSSADGNRNGTVDPGDYSFWRARFGTLAGAQLATLNVPESLAAIMLPLSLTLVFLRQQR